MHGLSDLLVPLSRVENPGATLPWRLVAQVLSMPASQSHNPMTAIIFVKSDH